MDLQPHSESAKIPPRGNIRHVPTLFPATYIAINWDLSKGGPQTLHKKK